MMANGLLSLKWNNHKSTFFQVLSTVRSKETYCDVTLACDGNFYPLHKFVLSTCSEYFEQMFEKTQCKHPIIVLKDIKSEELEALLNYMYIGEVNVVQDKLSGLIKAAECLQIKGLAVPDEEPIRNNQVSEQQKRHRVRQEESPKAKRRKRSSDYYDESVLNPKLAHQDVKPRLESNERSDSLNIPSEAGKNASMEFSHTNEDSVDEIIIEENVVKTEVVDPEVSDGDDLNVDGKNALYKQLNLEPSNIDDGNYVDAHALLENPEVVQDNMAGASGYQQANFSQWEGDGSLSNFPMEGFTGENDSQNSQLVDAVQASNSVRALNCGRQTMATEDLTVEGNLDKARNVKLADLNLYGLDTSALDGGSSFDVCQDMRGDQASAEGTANWLFCEFCSKSFLFASHLQRHRRCHTGERPFCCALCNYRATCKHHLTQHAKRMHGGAGQAAGGSAARTDMTLEQAMDTALHRASRGDD